MENQHQYCLWLVCRCSSGTCK